MFIRPLLVALLCWLSFAVNASAEGFVDLSLDKNKHSTDVYNFVVAKEIRGVQVLGIYDSTRYGEFFLGRSFDIGDNIKISPYGGIEWSEGISPKFRGTVVSMFSFENISGLSVIEFAGNTGNFNLQQIGYSFDDLTLSVVRHNLAGSGIRADWKVTPSASFYARKLERRTSVGINYTF